MSSLSKTAVIASGLFFSALTLGAQTYWGNSPHRGGNPSSYGLQLCDERKPILPAPPTKAMEGAEGSTTPTKKSPISRAG